MTTRSVPRDALRLPVARFAVTQGETAGDLPPVELLARTGDAIDHWYYGRVIHDFEGMNHKPRLPIDYGHGFSLDDQVGYLDEVDTSSGDLITRGKLVPDLENPEDAARKLAHKAAGGVPFEASIDFCDERTRFEELPEGHVATVNGRDIEGPCVIVRVWWLHGVAVAPRGADPNTEARFSDENQDTAVALDLPFTTTIKDTDSMTDENRPDENQPAADTNPTADAPAADHPAQDTPAGDATAADQLTPQEKTGPDYLAAFGDIGGTYFAEGKNWDEAQTAFRAHQAEQITALTAERDDLAAKLANVDRGDQVPATPSPDALDDSSADPAAKEAARLTPIIGKARADYAASVKVPS